ncbi:5-formyltetrahydrofolate cyclo-ligase [Pseudalkalibacillus salsuginis]|uniref:5-formyltetrahydrofolate cyclo-ligase n=1 Tax=Pseudalkalibacillus salsuginis TaxID=2910972 RepID=UPI001F1AF576|nr:5-formyltetrahydrofolate cyclo-ligase [Pseudalkalibacillus salsuginis]MCF6408475.1 5-formyltetrahydrofolate cyclo-ligase [Pseudalkalibacillus salsuginis]
MMEEKSELRKSTQIKLSALSKSVKEINEEKVRERLFQLEIWNMATTIGVTVSRGNEFNTYPIIEKAWEQKKTVAVPKCNSNDHSMDFRKLTSFDHLEIVYFGLKEPIVSKTVRVEPVEIDLLVVPGLLYDLNGYRIGFGGGYFDRYLKRYNGATISLLHPVQMTARVPTEPFDQPVDRLVLPDEIIET